MWKWLTKERNMDAPRWRRELFGTQCMLTRILCTGALIAAKLLANRESSIDLNAEMDALQRKHSERINREIEK